ncbi:YgjV family protein [Shewanella colwelliana]|uniref:Uroporphyrinogen decarboxylase n=1 Tax=Shewanella colwelliana TaxID=23 RepID=A0A1E5IS38_SHECO|nr:YgjV family protein [Shewanella colwelliana]MCZ4337262.1 YgjV family protein [Shewanella colwelliana]MDX1280078.1 YgjV family protein [Shewanella colwelliana]OEG73336.1 uroporphyrinogen decarboxylase [Shewanella colwelliana]GIU17410.1 uroporphyrinogen decarboxylase [Shewanella colwelliana]GIU39006.1 uroporphyrinogen decarboxylase [Shewanella colwelliana]
MEASNTIELIGYSASIMVAISLMMKDIVWLRCLNFTGCTLFVIYGVYISAWPVAGMNAFVACINIYHLVKIFRAKVKANTPAEA